LNWVLFCEIWEELHPEKLIIAPANIKTPTITFFMIIFLQNYEDYKSLQDDCYQLSKKKIYSKIFFKIISEELG
jgi:hypothetical protein